MSTTFAAIVTVAYLPAKQSFETLAWEWDARRDAREDIEDYLSSDRDTPVLTHLFTVDEDGTVIANPFTFPPAKTDATNAPRFAVVWRDRLGLEAEGFHDDSAMLERFDEAEYTSHTLPKPSEDCDGLGVYDLAADGSATRWSDADFDDAYSTYRGDVRQARRDLTALPRYYHAGVL